jgi:hypothetical protein
MNVPTQNIPSTIIHYKQKEEQKPKACGAQPPQRIMTDNPVFDSNQGDTKLQPSSKHHPVQKQTKYHQKLDEVQLSLIIDLLLHGAKWQGSTPQEEWHRMRYQDQSMLMLG